MCTYILDHITLNALNILRSVYKFFSHYFKEQNFLTFLKKERKLVELSGVEPLTSCVQGRRSTKLSYSPFFGGSGWTRTSDLTLIRGAL